MSAGYAGLEMNPNPPAQEENTPSRQVRIDL
jgi:hypothetical protein